MTKLEKRLPRALILSWSPPSKMFKESVCSLVYGCSLLPNPLNSLFNPLWDLEPCSDIRKADRNECFFQGASVNDGFYSSSFGHHSYEMREISKNRAASAFCIVSLRSSERQLAHVGPPELSVPAYWRLLISGYNPKSPFLRCSLFSFKIRSSVLQLSCINATTLRAVQVV